MPSANSTTEILEIRKSSLLERSKWSSPEGLEQLRTEMNWNFSENPELNGLDDRTDGNSKRNEKPD